MTSLDLERKLAVRSVSRGVLLTLLATALMLVAALAAGAQNEPVNPTTNHITGEIELKPVTKVDRAAGVWVDGQYVGYVKELHGEKKILLLPGEHSISV